MNVVDYLKKFLTEQPQQEAAIPGLGVFYSGQENGKNCILFKEVMPVDKAFLHFLAFEENMTEEEARAELETWVRRILQELKASGSVQIGDVGAFVIKGDKVEFVPGFGRAADADENFGLEERLAVEPGSKSISAPVLKDTAASSREERGLKPPVPVDKARGKNSFRHQTASREKQKPRPVSQPVTSGKEILLGDRKRPAPVSHGSGNAKWWLIAVGTVILILIVLLAIKPVRETLLGSGDRAPKEMMVPEPALIEENVDMMLQADMEEESFSDKEMTDHEKALAEENAKVAHEVIAGEAKKREQEAELKKAQVTQVKKTQSAIKQDAKKTAPKSTASAVSAKSAAKPVAKPTSKPASKQVSAQNVPIRKPVVGKFYIIVGSFASETNALNMHKKLRSEGYAPEVLRIETKGLYYVSVRTCSNREQAVAERTGFRDKNMECWIFAN